MSARGPVWWQELVQLDVAVYAAIAGTPTPTLDRGLRRLSHAADHSKLWLAGAAVLAAGGGAAGRRAAVNGLGSVALTSSVVNLVLKPLGARRRPDRSRYRVPVARHVAMPRSTSMPSGHAASAAAFATGVSAAAPDAGIPVNAMAALVGYSRVHTGVHYPLDVIAGTIAGNALAPVAVATLDRVRAWVAALSTAGVAPITERPPVSTTNETAGRPGCRPIPRRPRSQVHSRGCRPR